MRTVIAYQTVGVVCNSRMKMTNCHGVRCVHVLAEQNKRNVRKHQMDSDTEDEEMPGTAGIFDNLSHLNVIG